MTASREATLDTVRRARGFASFAHDGQTYGNGLPFIVHPAAAARILGNYGFGHDVIAAAWLHDVVEDTPVTQDQIYAAFGVHIGRLVDAVTCHGATHQDRLADTYDKVRAYPRAAIVRMGDRLANLANCKRGDRWATKYLRDAPGFEAVIRPLVPVELWAGYATALRRLK